VGGDCIVCPFHAWKWSGAGRNVDIPYSRILHNNSRIPTWHVWEESGLILLWHDAEGKEPYWEPMQFPVELDKYHPVARTNVVFRNKPMYGQWFIENIADPAHIKYVHKAQYIPSGGNYYWDGPNWTNSEEQRRLARPTAGTQGMSMILNHGRPTQIPLGDFDYSKQSNLAAETQVDDCVTDVFLVTYLVKEEGYPDELGPRATKAWQTRNKNVMLDFNLFDHMLYRDGPVWPPEESKKWNEVRRWARQFYPVDTGIREQPAGGGSNTVFERAEDAVVGGRRGKGPSTVFSGSGTGRFDAQAAAAAKAATEASTASD